MVGDEDPEVEDDDELAPDIIASDASAVDDIVSEEELNQRLTALSAEDSRLGQISITKVSMHYSLLEALRTFPFSTSSVHLPIKSSIAQL